MLARGLKRKCSEDEAPAGPLQCQSLLDMSLAKLQLCHLLAEPSLCRSVLIANTVRQIQEEMTQDGSWCLPGPQTAGWVPRDRLVSTEILCCSARAGPAPAPNPADLASALQAVPATQVPGAVPGGPRDRAGPGESRGGFPRSLDQVLETLASHGPGTVEEPFSDVDGSYYDLDAMLTGMVGGARSGPEGLETFASVAAPPLVPAAGWAWASWAAWWGSCWGPELQRREASVRLTETAGARGCGRQAPALCDRESPPEQRPVAPPSQGRRLSHGPVVPPSALTRVLRQPHRRTPAASSLIQL